jgi:uncharacterized protein YndB with AHSA1/START domain/DNA-binding transcriptional ArsR family regulator
MVTLDRQPLGCMSAEVTAARRDGAIDDVFRALADPSRRRLLDRLNARNGQSLRELCAGLDMARQSVTKHLAVLEAANLVTTVRRGREKLHYLNAVPINEIAERWIGRYDAARVQALADLKSALEDPTMSTTTTPARPAFVYSTYIRTTPEKLWQALTEPTFTLRYWGIGLRSDWRVGSPVDLQWGPDQEFHDIGQVVLEADPPRRLSYRWHNYQREHMAIFGWSEETFAKLVHEPRSKVTFELEPVGPIVKLVVTHDGFEGETEMLKGISEGWPAILSNLKTLLETGEPFPEMSPAESRDEASSRASSS